MAPPLATTADEPGSHCHHPQRHAAADAQRLLSERAHALLVLPVAAFLFEEYKRLGRDPATFRAGLRAVHTAWRRADWSQLCDLLVGRRDDDGSLTRVVHALFVAHVRALDGIRPQGVAPFEHLELPSGRAFVMALFAECAHRLAAVPRVMADGWQPLIAYVGAAARSVVLGMLPLDAILEAYLAGSVVARCASSASAWAATTAEGGSSDDEDAARDLARARAFASGRVAVGRAVARAAPPPPGSSSSSSPAPVVPGRSPERPPVSDRAPSSPPRPGVTTAARHDPAVLFSDARSDDGSVGWEGLCDDDY